MGVALQLTQQHSTRSEKLYVVPVAIWNEGLMQFEMIYISGNHLKSYFVLIKDVSLAII